MLKSTFSCLQQCRRQYWSIFICLAVVVSEICEIPQNYLKIRTTTVQGHPRSSILVSIESTYRYATSYYSLIVTLDVYPTVFEILIHLASKQLVFPTPPLFNANQRRNALKYQHNLYIAEKYSQWATTILYWLSLVYLHTFSRCCLPKSRDHAKFRQNLTSQQFKVI